jgi:GNAT superfamily N-acetyltransferase
MYSLKILCEEEASGFGGFTFPYYRSMLGEMLRGGRMIAIGAVAPSEAVGLVVAELKESNRIATVCSIAVAPQQRRKGIATALLRQVESELVAHGCRLAEVIYMAERPSTPAVEGLLKKNGWLPANLRLMICTSDFDLLSRAPWMRQTDFPATFEIFPWKELTDRERAHILKSQENEPWFPEALSPFAHQDTIERLCSFGLRYNGQVIGWCIVHQLGADTLRCGALFVGKEFAPQGRAIALLARSILATRETGRRNFIFNVSFQRPRMIQFVRRRMAPYLKSIQITKESRKELTSECLAA